MSRYECTKCGLTPVDLPDDIDPDDAFTLTDGRCYCIVDDPESDEWERRAHADPYCATNCSPGHKHSQCGCTCDHRSGDPS